MGDKGGITAYSDTGTLFYEEGGCLSFDFYHSLFAEKLKFQAKSSWSNVTNFISFKNFQNKITFMIKIPEKYSFFRFSWNSPKFPYSFAICSNSSMLRHFFLISLISASLLPLRPDHLTTTLTHTTRLAILLSRNVCMHLLSSAASFGSLSCRIFSLFFCLSFPSHLFSYSLAHLRSIFLCKSSPLSFSPSLSPLHSAPIYFLPSITRQHCIISIFLIISVQFRINCFLEN